LTIFTTVSLFGFSFKFSSGNLIGGTDLHTQIHCRTGTTYLQAKLLWWQLQSGFFFAETFQSFVPQ